MAAKLDGPRRAANQRKAFGDALADALNMRRMTQLEVGRLVGGITQSAVSAWRSGDTQPDPHTVFELERILSLPAGYLSKHLGYVPVASLTVTSTVQDVITADPLLDEIGKRTVLAVYRELTAPKGTSRGRPTARRKT